MRAKALNKTAREDRKKVQKKLERTNQADLELGPSQSGWSDIDAAAERYFEQMGTAAAVAGGEKPRVASPAPRRVRGWHARQREEWQSWERGGQSWRAWEQQEYSGGGWHEDGGRSWHEDDGRGRGRPEHRESWWGQSEWPATRQTGRHDRQPSETHGRGGGGGGGGGGQNTRRRSPQRWERQREGSCE